MTTTSADKKKNKKAVVEAAERLIEEAYQVRWLEKLEKSQTSTLASVAREATCAEEVENWLRYQAGRGQWPRELAERVIAEARNLYPDNDDIERARVWVELSVYFARAYTYRRAIVDGRI
jgi:hypothetical protein